MLEILLISAGAVLETLFIMRSYKRRDVSSVVLKTAASVVFVLLGLLELRRMGPSVYGWYVVAGLTLGMLGDLLLALRFLSESCIGCSLRLALCRFPRAYCLHSCNSDALPGGVAVCNPHRGGGAGRGLFLRVCQGGARGQNYAARRGLYRRRSVYDSLRGDRRIHSESSRALFLFFVGGICFSASDNMLVVLSFGKNDSPYRNAVLHVLYYMAQIFIALTIQFA